MKVQVEGNLYIEGDDRNVEIRRYKKDKNDKDVYETLGYFGTVEQAVQRAINMKYTETNAKDLKEMMGDIKSIKQWVKDQFN